MEARALDGRKGFEILVVVRNLLSLLSVSRPITGTPWTHNDTYICYTCIIVISTL